MADSEQTIKGGRVVLFDGMDGTGKTTQLQIAAAALVKQGWLVKTVRAHGGTPIGEALREVSLSHIARPPLTDMYLSLAIHASLAQQLAEWRQRGALILMDRGPLSIIGYQTYGDGLSPEIVWPMVESDLNLISPDLSLVFTADVGTAMERARHKLGGGSDFFESKDKAYFKRVNAGYLAAAEKTKAAIIDSGTLSVDMVSQRIMALLNPIISES